MDKVMGMPLLTIKIPKIEGISPMGLKKDIDYLIAKEQSDTPSATTLATRVVVSDEKPSKVFRSRDYTVVTGMTTPISSSVGSSGGEFILSTVTVDYPEQTCVEVTLEGTNASTFCDDGTINMICKEIENYLCLYRVDVVNNVCPKSTDIEQPPVGLEVSVCIPELSTSLRQKLKKDIDHIVKKAGFHSHADEAEQHTPSTHIKHTVRIADSPNDPDGCMVIVMLEGDAEKVYYETMWDINRKIKSYSK